MSSNIDVLGIGNPFDNRVVVCFEQEFIKDHGLEKGDTSVTSNPAEVKNTYQAANKFIEKRQIGGSCANVIKVLARLGKTCGLNGIIGHDEHGEWIRQQLKKIGVHDFLNATETPTGTANCFITRDRRQTIQIYLGASQELTKDDLETSAFQKAGHIHLESDLANFDQVLPQALSLAKEHQTTTSLDLSSKRVVQLHKKMLFPLAKEVDILFGNLEEMQELTGKTEIDEIINAFSVRQIIVITKGDRGSTIKWKGESTAKNYGPPYAKGLCNTLGAGDFFCGGFLYGALSDFPAETCVRIANRVTRAVLISSTADLFKSDWSDLKQQISNPRSMHDFF